jgi:hypothetical protein
MIDSISSGRRPALRRLGPFVFVAMLAAFLSIAAPARAATINTYSFTQDGYSLSGGVTADIEGTFSGYVGADGFMHLAGLQTFHLQTNFHYLGTHPVSNSVGMPSEFFFNTLGGNSTFTLVVAMDNFAPGEDKVCIGSLTAFRCGISPANGAFANIPISTLSFAQLTLVSSSAVTTPIPAPILLLATALSGLGLLGAQARRQKRAAA